MKGGGEGKIKEKMIKKNKQTEKQHVFRFYNIAYTIIPPLGRSMAGHNIVSYCHMASQSNKRT